MSYARLAAEWLARALKGLYESVEVEGDPFTDLMVVKLPGGVKVALEWDEELDSFIVGAALDLGPADDAARLAAALARAQVVASEVAPYCALGLARSEGHAILLVRAVVVGADRQLLIDRVLVVGHLLSRIAASLEELLGRSVKPQPPGLTM